MEDEHYALLPDPLDAARQRPTSRQSSRTKRTAMPRRQAFWRAASSRLWCSEAAHEKDAEEEVAVGFLGA
jgi:hypothetical protein